MQITISIIPTNTKSGNKTYKCYLNCHIGGDTHIKRISIKQAELLATMFPTQS